MLVRHNLHGQLHGSWQVLHDYRGQGHNLHGQLHASWQALHDYSGQGDNLHGQLHGFWQVLYEVRGLFHNVRGLFHDVRGPPHNSGQVRRNWNLLVRLPRNGYLLRSPIQRCFLVVSHINIDSLGPAPVHFIEHPIGSGQSFNFYFGFVG